MQMHNQPMAKDKAETNCEVKSVDKIEWYALELS